MLPGSPVAATVADTSFYSNNYMNDAARKDPYKLGGMFEAIFYRTIFQQMRDSSIGEDPFMNSAGAKQIRTMMDDELANALGREGHMGFGEMIAEQNGLLKGVQS